MQQEDTANCRRKAWREKERQRENLAAKGRYSSYPGVGERERERDSRRWYRIAGERNVVTFKLEWTTVCVAESRVGSLSSPW